METIENKEVYQTFTNYDSSSATSDLLFDTTDIIDFFSNLTEIVRSLKIAAYGVNILDGVLNLIAGLTQLIQAEDSKLNINEKRFWGGTTAATGVAVLSAEALSTTAAFASLTAVATAGVTLYSGLTFTLGMLVSLLHTIRQTEKAYKKMDPEYLIEDRLKKVIVVSDKIEILQNKLDLEKKLNKEDTTTKIKLENDVEQLKTTQTRLMYQVIALSLNVNKDNNKHNNENIISQETSQTDSPEQKNNPNTNKSAHKEIQNLKSVITTANIRNNVKLNTLAKLQLEKQRKKYKKDFLNIALLSIGTIGVGLISISPLLPVVLPLGIICTGVASGLGLAKLGKTYILDKIKKSITINNKKSGILQKKNIQNIKSLNQEDKVNLYEQLGNAKMKPEFEKNSQKEQNNILDHLLEKTAKNEILNDVLASDKMNKKDELISTKEQKRQIQSYANKKYSLKNHIFSLFYSPNKDDIKFKNKMDHFQQCATMAPSA